MDTRSKPDLRIAKGPAIFSWLMMLRVPLISIRWSVMWWQ